MFPYLRTSQGTGHIQFLGKLFGDSSQRNKLIRLMIHNTHIYIIIYFIVNSHKIMLKLCFL